MSALQDLQSQVTINTTVEGSALTLIRGLVASLDDAGTDPAALEQVVAQLKTSQAQLASAVAANTIVRPRWRRLRRTKRLPVRFRRSLEPLSLWVRFRFPLAAQCRSLKPTPCRSPGRPRKKPFPFRQTGRY